jgi:hypothetical protein
MIKFDHLRELNSKKLEGDVVSNFRVDRIPVQIRKDKTGYIAYVDGDRLDRYTSHSQANKAATQFVKQYGKMK